MLASPFYNEKKVLAQLAAGDDNAFVIVYERYHKVVNNFIRRYVKSPEAAEDLAQEVFMKIWKRHEQLVEINSFKSYLLRVTRNHTIDFLRRAAKLDIAKAEIIYHAREMRSVTNEVIVLNEYVEQLRKVYESLSPKTQEVFKLVKGEGRSYEEVAALLGLSRNAVKMHIMKGNKAFKNFLKDDIDFTLPLLLFLFFRS